MTDVLQGYVPVAERLIRFYDAHPDGRIATTAPVLVDVGERTFLSVTATVWRSPDDLVPCVASAWEPFPGRTNFTRDSEAMNCETSAVGRALGLAGIEVHRSVATREEVDNRRTGPGIGKPDAKGRVLAAAHGDQAAARRAWELVVPADLSTIPVELVEAAENVAGHLAAPSPADTASPTGGRPANPLRPENVSGIAAARAALEEATE